MSSSCKVVVSAPGKVILHGEHSVVYGKKALVVSLDMRTYLTLERTKDTVVLDLPDISINMSWNLCQLSDMFEWRRRGFDYRSPTPVQEQLHVVVRDMLSSYGYEYTEAEEQAFLSFFHLYTSLCEKPTPVHITVKSDVRPGAGLGSSASYSVVLTTALLALRGAIDYEASTNHEEGVRTLTKTSMDLISQWAFMSEKVIHGTPSGIDNSICTYGGAVQFKAGEVESIASFPCLRILLVNSGVPRSTKKLVSLVRERHVQLPCVTDTILHAMEQVVEKCLQLFNNNQRGEHLQEEQYCTLESLIDVNQALLSSLGVSHQTLDDICKVATEHGLHAKLTGAGGGGFAFILLRPDTSVDVVTSLRQKLEGNGYECFEANVGGPGVQVSVI